MNFYENFIEACRDFGTTPTTLCQSLGLSGATATNWKKNQSTPNFETAVKIAETLNITLDRLAYGKTFTEAVESVNSALTASSSDLSKAERDLVALFRSASLGQQAQVFSILSGAK